MSVTRNMLKRPKHLGVDKRRNVKTLEMFGHRGR
jgi:hypothetical protein